MNVSVYEYKNTYKNTIVHVVLLSPDPCLPSPFGFGTISFFSCDELGFLIHLGFLLSIGCLCILDIELSLYTTCNCLLITNF